MDTTSDTPGQPVEFDDTFLTLSLVVLVPHSHLATGGHGGSSGASTPSSFTSTPKV